MELESIKNDPKDDGEIWCEKGEARVSWPRLQPAELEDPRGGGGGGGYSFLVIINYTSAFFFW